MIENAVNSNPAGAAVKGSYALVNGVNLYYETYGAPGEAAPALILLHGGLGGTGMFAGLLPLLAQGRQVIAVELQAHGHTADVDRPMRFEAMADDIAALIQHLSLETADLCGYSLGGGVALQTAIRHPQVVRKLVLISTPFQREGWYPEVLAGMATMSAQLAPMMVGAPIYTEYTRAAPDPTGWPVLLDKLGQLLRQDYDWSAGVAHMQTPTLVIVGDADSVRTSHAVELFGLLGGGKVDGGLDGSGMPTARLAILPGTTHFTILDRIDLLPAIIPPFLDAPLPAPRA